MSSSRRRANHRSSQRDSVDGHSSRRSRPHYYSARPITRFQFIMLQAMEAGEELSPAMQQALDTAAEHPDWDVFERATYQAWADASRMAASDMGTR